jgi:ubiquinol-cytochrome c reductase iron-sulfur subunit
MSDQNDTPETGPEGQVPPARGAGSIFDRVKVPREPVGTPLPQGRDDGPEALGTPPHQTDSSRQPATEVLLPPSAGTERVAPPAAEVDRRAERRAERLIAALMLLSMVGTVGFVITNFVGDKHQSYYTPCMGLALALALGGIGFGMILWAKRLMPHVEAVQERHPFTSPPEEIAVTEEEVKLGYEDTGLGKFPLLRRSMLGALTVFGAVAVVPLLNLTNSKPGKKLDHTLWVKGARLVTEEGNFVKLGDLSIGSIETVFPAVPVKTATGSVRYEPQTSINAKATSTTIVIRLPPGINRPRPGRENWAVDGHVAYSKICTHAGCPVSLYEQQTHHLLCPCHQSVFNVVDGCRAIFGPASRSLPQLPLAVDADGYFIARDGDYDEPVGPAFWERS